MKKVVVLIPVHCAPKVAMMTLGSWLEACDGSYEAEIILGVHANYHHYHDGLASLQSLPVRLSVVPEMNWDSATPEDALVRYSRMHAISLRAMMKMAAERTFDHLAILDHDLVFKTDFVVWAMNTEADLVGSYMDDRKESIPINTNLGVLVFAPKFSVWHMVMTSRFFDRIMDDVDLIFPEVRKGWFYDTFSRVIAANQDAWHMPVREMTAAQMTEMVRHVWSMSFNFGHHTFGADGYHRRLAECQDAYDQRFPKGIGHLFRKVGL